MSTVYNKVTVNLDESKKVFKKVNGVWVEQSDLTAVFDSNTNYRKGN